MSEVTLRQLEYFAAIADTGSMTRAAVACRVTQAAVSSALGQLERAVGTPLVIRRPGRGVALTPEGIAVAARARDILEQVGGVSSVVSELRGRLSGRLPIGVYRTLAPHTIPALIDWFGSRHPDVSLEFVEGDGPSVQRELLAGRVQLAIIYRAQLLRGCDPTVLREGRRMAVMSPDHPLARRRRRLTLPVLAEHPAILLDEEPALQHTLAAFASERAQPHVPWRSRSIEAIHNVVGRGLAYSILMQTRSHSPEGRPLLFRAVEGPALDNPVAGVLPSGVGPSALVSEALAAIRDYWVATDAALAARDPDMPPRR